MNILRQICNRTRLFHADDRGYVMVFFVLVLTPILGITALVLDLSRQQTLHTQLQSIVDAAALAGANELDGSPSSTSKATTAVDAYLSTEPAFASGTSGARTISFFREIGCTTPAVTPEEAECVQVTSAVSTVTVMFAQAIGFADDLQAQASATAESRYVACAVQPLFICNPDESSDFNPSRGDLFQFIAKEDAGTKTAGKAFYPGDFGLLDPPEYPNAGAKLIEENIAKESPGVCYINSISVRTGKAAGPVGDGINVRFDHFQGDVPNEPPAPLIVQGRTFDNGNVCNPGSYELNDLGMPRDSCFYGIGDPCSQSGPMLKGSGNWGSTPAAAAYWNAHHSDKLKSSFKNEDGDQYGETGYTRYDLYMDELSITDINQAPPYNNLTNRPDAPENVTPLCRTPGPASRRIIYTAVINCEQYAVTGNSQPPISGGGMAEWFITEPSSGGEVWVEFIRMMEPGSDDGKLRHIVQLVRDFPE